MQVGKVVARRREGRGQCGRGEKRGPVKIFGGGVGREGRTREMIKWGMQLGKRTGER